MAHAWIIAANHLYARIFEAAGRDGAINEIATLYHPEARQHGMDVTADASGRSFDSVGSGRHAMGDKHDLRQLAAQRFARELADVLEHGRQEQAYERLYIVADPAVLGVLREALTPATRACVAAEIDKNLVTHEEGDIRGHLPERL